jgi:hypothetical protein
LVPDRSHLLPVVEEVVDQLDAVRTGDAELAFADYRGAILGRGLLEARVKLPAQAERLLFSGLHFIKEPGARLVQLIAVPPAISPTAEVRVPSALFGEGEDFVDTPSPSSMFSATKHSRR